MVSQKRGSRDDALAPHKRQSTFGPNHTKSGYTSVVHLGFYSYVRGIIEIQGYENKE